MPNIDVTDLMSDPDFASPVEATRAIQAVGQNGRATYTSQITYGIGVVSPANTAELLRLPEGSRTQGAITVRTVMRLSAGDPSGYPADTVAWQGATYTVRQVNDWSHFGAGYVEAVCERIPLA